MNRDYHDFPFGITRIDTHYIRPQMTAAYLLVENGRAVFIETGPLLAAAKLLQALKRADLTPGDVDAVIVTHVHLDHAGGAGELMRLCPEAQLIVHPSGAKHLVNPEKLKASATAVYGEERFKTTLGDIIAVDSERVVTPADGDKLLVGGRELLLIDTPGHARHHLAVWDQKSRGLFSGDSFGISYREFDGGTTPFIFPATTPVQLDPELLHNTLDKIAGLKPERLYLTHFDSITYQPELLQTLHRQLDQYLELVKSSNSHQQLVAAINNHMRGVLEDIQSPVAEALIEPLLAADQELNAQGLEVWLSRINKNSENR
ncbi:MAG: MBL fold metallo-hydrolase [Magnetococcales bacterium]|nr:MBL fold metallo-hydrolase [Magnetococcales bacterium]